MILPDFSAMYADMAKGMEHVVHCTVCRREQDVDPEWCLRTGWPKCHDYTMRLGPPPDHAAGEEE